MHTPGPWMIEADPCHYDTLSTVVGGESQQRKSRIWRQVHVEVGGFAEVAEQEANARLIAAAPDLYEALKPVRSSGEFGDRAEDAPVTIRLSAEEFRAICRAMDRAAPCSDATDTPHPVGAQEPEAKS